MKINTNNLPLYLLCIYFIFAFAFGYGLLQQIFFVLFVGVTFFFAFMTNRFTIGRFGKGYIFMTIWSIIQLLLGICYDFDASKSMITTLMINCMFIIAVYIVISNSSNIIRVFDYIINAFFVTLSVIVVGSGSSLLNGRLGLANEQGISFTIGPLISSISPNGISLWCTIGFLMCLICKDITHKKKYFFMSVYFVIGNVICASRKGFIILLAGFLLYYVLSSTRKEKFYRWTVSLCGIAFAIVIVLTNATLYQMIGYRFVELFNMFILQTANVDIVGGSLRTRIALLNYAKEYFYSQPLVGHGINSFSSMCPLHIVADNNYYEILVAGGIIGLILYYLPLVLIIVSILRNGVKDKIWALIISLVAIVIISDLTSSSYYLRETLLPYVLLDGLECYQRKYYYSLKKRYNEKS